MNETITIDQVSKAVIKPGDVIVITYNKPLKPEITSRIKTYIKGIFPDNKRIVLGEGTTLEVITPDADEA